MDSDSAELLAFWKSDPQRPPWWRYRVIERYRACRSSLYVGAFAADEWLRRLQEFVSALRKITSRFSRSRQRNFTVVANNAADVSPARMLQLAMDDELFRYRVWKIDPALTEAYRIFLLSEEDARRAELEARILAGQDFEEIAVRTGYDQQVLAAYGACFFDVLDRLNQPSYILHQVIFPAGSIVSGGQLLPCQLLRAVGYFAGPQHLERMLAGGLSQAEEDVIGSAYEWQIRFVGWLSAMAMPSMMNRFNVVEIARVTESAISRHKTLESAQEAASGSTSWDKALLAVMEGVPWSVGPSQELHLKQSGYAGLNKVGQEPRAGELLAEDQSWQSRKERLDRRLTLPSSKEKGEE